MIEYASGGPTGHIFRAKARGFNALKTETWERRWHTLDCMPPHVSVTSHGAQVASQHSLILQTGDGIIPWCYQMARESWHVSIHGSSKMAARESSMTRNKGAQLPLKKSCFVV